MIPPTSPLLPIAQQQMVRGSASLEDIEPLKPLRADDARIFSGRLADRWWKRCIIVLTSPLWFALFMLAVVGTLAVYITWAFSIGQLIAYVVTGRRFKAGSLDNWWPKKENKS